MAKISPLMIAPPLIFGAFAVLAAIGMFREDPNALPSAREGQPAPPVVLTEFPGKQGFDDATLRDGQVKLVVLDARGRHVRTLVNGVRPGGTNEIHWDGTDDGGRSVASGTYLYRLEAAGLQYTRAATLVK